MKIPRLPFKKMHGSGNDFILIDNRHGAVRPLDVAPLARKLCRRRTGVGADGLILIEESKEADFRWRFHNADGSEAEMCGNGGRCAARFAFLTGICGPEMTFETLAGPIRAEVKEKRVKLELPRPKDLSLDMELELHGRTWKISSINTGVPHGVIFVDDLDSVPVFDLGRLVRHHERFAPAGTNVNFVHVENEGRISIRTYERGVEDETLACGTGSVASAIIAAIKGMVASPVVVKTWGGEELKVYFELRGETVTEVFLEGGAVVVYSGLLDGDL